MKTIKALLICLTAVIAVEIIALFIVMAIALTEIHQNDQYPIHVWDRETVSTATNDKN